MQWYSKTTPCGLGRTPTRKPQQDRGEQQHLYEENASTPHAHIGFAGRNNIGHSGQIAGYGFDTTVGGTGEEGAHHGFGPTTMSQGFGLNGMYINSLSSHEGVQHVSPLLQLSDIGVKTENEEA